jgi:hypothetical protein
VAVYIFAGWPLAYWLFTMDALQNRHLVGTHLCRSSMVISDDDWCVRIAQSEYLALRKSKQIELAKQFFDEDIELSLANIASGQNY